MIEITTKIYYKKHDSDRKFSGFLLGIPDA